MAFLYILICILEKYIGTKLNSTIKFSNTLEIQSPKKITLSLCSLLHLSFTRLELF